MAAVDVVVHADAEYSEQGASAASELAPDCGPVTVASLLHQLESTIEPLKLGPHVAFTLPKGKAQCGLVWIHGLGDDETGWADALEDEFQSKVPCKFVLPRAPVQSVTTNGGARTTSWFDMRKLPLGSGDQPPRHGCSLEQAVASCSRVHAAIDLLVDEGIPPERIVVGGFSQGGAMSLLSALTYREKLGGIIVFSGIVFFGELLPQLVATRRDMRVFWGHGSEDELLKPSLQDVGVKLLSEAGLCITAKMYRVGHSSDAQEMEDASNFFSDILGLA